MLRLLLALVLATGCRAEVLGSGTDIDAGDRADAPQSFDANTVNPDAGVDARTCAGGDAAATAPDGSCLVHVFAPSTYDQAKAGCAAMSARLAVLSTAAVDSFAENFVGTRDTLIGLSDRAAEGTFVWDDGSALQFANWHLGEPNDGDDTYDEDCTIIAGSRTGKQWDDRPCAPLPQFPMSGTYAYLCQY